VPFPWDGEAGLEGLRIGYVPAAFEGDGSTSDFDRTVLEVIRGLGARPTPVELPDEYPLSALRVILSAEAAAAFDDLTRTNRDDELVRQTPGSWPNSFRTARFIPAVEYLQANRVRTMVMGAMESAMAKVDVLITPSFAESVLLMTNLTGHPAVVLPSGFTEERTPVSFSFIGGLWKDAEALRMAKAYQDATDHHRQHPERFLG
jgi:Asp-tRNA(Asn)/Glu-tRNA(Gln) amidotransferase A subunit family amidase